MKNVMKKAWEIAREGVRKFGGNVKEYFAEALRMAWTIVKNGMEIGYELLGKKNGVMHFIVNDVDGLEVSFLTEEKSIKTGKQYTKKNPINAFKTGTNNKTGKKARMYSVAIHCGDIEIKLGNESQIIKNHIDKKWM